MNQQLNQCESKRCTRENIFSSYRNNTDAYALTNDASMFANGAIISQRQQWCESVMVYASKTLSKRKRNHSATYENFGRYFFLLNT